MAAFANTASIKWAQRKDSLYVTICLADVTNHTLELTDKSLTFTGTADKKEYGVTLDFFKEVDSEGSISKVLPQSIQMKIMKKDQEDEEFWPRLLVDKLKEKNMVKIDWDRYVDEDEEEEGFDEAALAGGQGMGGMPPGMGGMGGPGGPGGMDMAAMMQQMGGMGGAGGPGGGGMPDMAEMMKSMGGAGGMGGMPGGMGGGDDEGEDSDDNLDMPDLEETN